MHFCFNIMEYQVFTSIYQKIPIDLDYRNYEYNYKFAIVVVEVPAQN